MKKSDIAMIVLIVSVSMVLAYFVARTVLGGAENQTAKVQTVEPITSEVSTPDPAIFNKNAINPTVEVLIGSVDVSKLSN